MEKLTTKRRVRVFVRNAPNSDHLVETGETIGPGTLLKLTEKRKLYLCSQLHEVYLYTSGNRQLWLKASELA